MKFPRIACLVAACVVGSGCGLHDQEVELAGDYLAASRPVSVATIDRASVDSRCFGTHAGGSDLVACPAGALVDGRLAEAAPGPGARIISSR